MWIINSDTNCWVGGVKIPIGQVEVPFHGSINILTSQTDTNLAVGTADTLVVWPEGAAVREGYDVYAGFTLGVWLVVSVFALLAVARRMSSILSGGKVREV